MATKEYGLYPSDELRSRQPSSFVAPAPIANFKGSFVYKDTDTPFLSEGPSTKSRVSDWLLYFRDGWTDIGIWKSAFVEAVATGLLCYLSGLIGATIINFDTPQGAAYAAVTNTFLLTLFIMAAGPGSGGHVNPTITFATMLTGLTGFSRGILYIIGQLLGSAVAGGVLHGALIGQDDYDIHGGGCFREEYTVTAAQAFLIETFSVFALLFLAFGVALDPRQQKLFGMFAAPLAVGCSVGIVSFASGGLFSGYSGASMHPGRCFAFAVARHNFADQWIWWLGPIVGSFLQMICFRIAPPYHSTAVPSER